jgi:hypothetical protein
MMNARLLASIVAVAALLPSFASAQIAFRGASTGNVAGTTTITYRGSGAFANRANCGTILPALPAGTAAGDLMIAVVVARGTATTLTMTGWTQLFLQNPVSGYTAAIYWRLATGGDPITITQAGTCDVIGARISGFVGVDTTQPFVTAPLAAGNWSYQNAGSVTTGTETATFPGAMFIATGQSNDDDTFGALAGGTQAYTSSTTTGNDMAIALYYALSPTAVTVGPYNFTKSQGTDPNHGTVFALRPTGANLTVPVPAATINGDVMIASISMRPCSGTDNAACTTTLGVPAGWTLVNSFNQQTGGSTGGFGLRFFVYQRVASGEPASYTWVIGGAPVNAGGVGGIVSFSGVDNASPIVVQAGNITASANTVVAPSVNTGAVAGTMLVSSHVSDSAGTFTPPGGMTEAADVASVTTPNDVGIALEMNYEAFAGSGATGTRTATLANPPAADAGAAHLLALRPLAAAVPGGFNAYETSTAAGAITGVIKTKIAGTAATVDIVALNPARTAILTTFAGTVRVEVLNSSDNTGALNATTGCRASWVNIQTLAPDIVFALANNGRKSITFTVAEAYRDARIRVTYPVGAPTATGCSSDNFAIRPAALVNVNATDTTWLIAGTTRALANGAAVGGNVHKAGLPFTLRATAQNSAGVTTANYNGSPTLASMAFTLPVLATCATCSLAPGAWSGSGTVTSTTAAYSEAGAISIVLEDVLFAAVDLADSTVAERTITQPTSAPVGRFVPDRFVLTTANTPRFRTFQATEASCSCPDAPTCTAARRTFTYIGQPFGWVTPPQVLITATNSSGATTVNYSATLWKVAAADVTETYSPATATFNDLAKGLPTVAAIGSGTGTTTSNAAGTFNYVRDNAAPQALFDANITLTVSVQDASENVASQGIIATTTAAAFTGGGTGIAFDGGGASNGEEFRYGRLWLSSAFGSELLNLAVPLEAQYWNGFGFVRNAVDNCTTLTAANVKLGAYSPAGFSAGEPQANVSISGPFVGGRANLKLLKPIGAARGSLTICVDLDVGAAGDTTCQAATPAIRTYLDPRLSPSVLYDRDPVAKAGFGVYKGPESVIYQREIY